MSEKDPLIETHKVGKAPPAGSNSVRRAPITQRRTASTTKSSTASSGDRCGQWCTEVRALAAQATHRICCPYPGVDGIITSFATVTSVAGASLAPTVIIVLGLAHLVAEGLSMGVGSYLSQQAEDDFARAERRREEWEMRHDLPAEIKEMTDILERKGVASDDATQMMTTLARYPQAFLDVMMALELGIVETRDAAGEASPARAGAMTMASFVLFGCVPLLPFLVALLAPSASWTAALRSNLSVQLWVSVVFTVLTLFALGAIKAMMVSTGSGGHGPPSGSMRWVRSGLETALLGSGAAAAGWLIGYCLRDLGPSSA